jgi:hypothetical protein
LGSSPRGEDALADAPEVLRRHLDQRRPLDVLHTDRVEEDVDAVGALDEIAACFSTCGLSKFGARSRKTPICSGIQFWHPALMAIDRVYHISPRDLDLPRADSAQLLADRERIAEVEENLRRLPGRQARARRAAATAEAMSAPGQDLNLRHPV